MFLHFSTVLVGAGGDLSVWPLRGGDQSTGLFRLDHSNPSLSNLFYGGAGGI